MAQRKCTKVSSCPKYAFSIISLWEIQFKSDSSFKFDSIVWAGPPDNVLTHAGNAAAAALSHCPGAHPVVRGTVLTCLRGGVSMFSETYLSFLRVAVVQAPNPQNIEKLSGGSLCPFVPQQSLTSQHQQGQGPGQQQQQQQAQGRLQEQQEQQHGDGWQESHSGWSWRSRIFESLSMPLKNSMNALIQNIPLQSKWRCRTSMFQH